MNGEKGLLEIVQECLRTNNVQLPVFSETSQRLQQELHKDSPDLEGIENLITRDQSLTAQVLRTANSPFYRGLAKTATIRDSIVRLGLNEIFNLVLLASQRSNFRARDPFIKDLMDKLWQHSVACAVGARWIARQCNFRALQNEAFVAGLLHDLGKVLLLKVIDDLKSSGTLTAALNAGVIQQTLTDLHTECGYTLLTNWDLPDFYCIIARDHHKDPFDQANDLLVIVRMANHACWKTGIGMKEDPQFPLATGVEAGLLGLQEIALAELQIELEDSANLADGR